MTRRWTEGFEAGSSYVITYFNSDCKVDAKVGRGGYGSYALRHFYTPPPAYHNLGFDLSEFYFRCAFQYQSGSYNNGVFYWSHTGAILGSVRVAAGGALQIYVGGGLVATGAASEAPLASTWYLIEAHVVISDDVNVGKIEVRVEGFGLLCWRHQA